MWKLMGRLLYRVLKIGRRVPAVRVNQPACCSVVLLHHTMYPVTAGVDGRAYCEWCIRDLIVGLLRLGELH